MDIHFSSQEWRRPEIINNRVSVEIGLSSSLAELFRNDLFAFTSGLREHLLQKPNDQSVTAALQHYASDPYSRTSINEASIMVHEENIGVEPDGTGWVHFTFDVDYNEGCKERNCTQEDQEEMFDIKINGLTAILTGREIHERIPDDY